MAAGGVINAAIGSNPSMSRELGFQIRSAALRDEAVRKVTDALDVEGFIVVTRIEVDQVFDEEIGTKYRPYTILGVCSPPLAHATLTEAPQLGLMFPLNVTIEADISGSLIRIMDPELLSQSGNLAADDPVQRVAKDARRRLHRVAEALRAQNIGNLARS